MLSINMMRFDEFKEYVVAHILGYLPPRFAYADVKVQEINRMDGNNYTGMTCSVGDGVCPVANLELFFEQYEATQDSDAVMESIAECLMTELPADVASVQVSIENYAEIKSQLMVKLVNVEMAAALGDCPCTLTVGDMVFIYYILISRDNNGEHVARVNNGLLAKWGITVQQLHTDAMAAMAVSENGPCVKNFGGMIIATNQSGVNGAACLFVDNLAEDISANVFEGGSYFIIPSSVHEMICVPDNGVFGIDDLTEMLASGNQTVVDEHEILSYKIYYYDADERKVRVA